MERKYRFLGYFMLLLFPLTFLGFYKTYFQHFPVHSQKVDWFAHGHALIATLWLSLLIIQPLLVARRKYAVHRTIGKFSYFVFGLLILSFVPQITKVIQTGNYRNLFFPLGDTILLVTFYTLAVVNKRNIAKHMRYMIATALVFLGPTVGRMGPLLLGWSELLTQNVQ